MEIAQRRAGETGRSRTENERQWRNWAGLESVRPVRWLEPGSVEDVVTAVQEAAKDGHRVKAVGSSHSFSGIARAQDVLLDLRRLNAVRALDADTGLVTVDAGITLHELSPWLWRAGLSLTNLGDIDRQSVAGAVSTGTHGTGTGFGSVSSQVRRLELVLADGELVTCSADERPELFAAARVGIGAFGVITGVTLQCEPAFGLHAVERSGDLADTLDRIEELLAGHDHVEFFWFPHTDAALLKFNRRLAPGAGLDPLPAWRSVLDDELLANTLLDKVCRVGAVAPRTIPTLNRICARLYGSREYSDRSYRVFASSRRIKFRETEWGIPLEEFGSVMREVRAWFEDPGRQIGFPLEIRFGAAEDAWLSAAHGRPTAWISAQTYLHQVRPDYLTAVGDICWRHGGRPHWGKLHDLSAAELRPRYPRFDDAVAVRDEVDPDRRFGNAYLERVLG